MLLTEFVLIYGEDWFSIPIDVERGSIVRFEDLVVTNTYGERFVIKPSGSPSDLSWDRWSTGHPASASAESTFEDRDRLVVFAPVALSATSGPAMEEVVLARDEAANVVWGIELLAVNELGEATELLGYWGDNLMGASSPPQGPGLHYTLITDVPATWFPFSPRLDRSVTPRPRPRRSSSSRSFGQGRTETLWRSAHWAPSSTRRIRPALTDSPRSRSTVLPSG